MAQKNAKKVFASTAVTALAATAVIPAATSAQTFTDVPQNHDYAGVISTLANEGIIAGYSDGTFRMGESLTRAEASAMVARILQYDDDVQLDLNAPAAPFTDVKQGVWYSDPINALYEAGIIEGTGGNEFDPGETMTRAQISQLLVEAYDIEPANVDLPFTDMVAGAWYEPAIAALYNAGYINGQTPTTFGPNDNIKRGDFAWLLYNTHVGVNPVDPEPVPNGIEEVTSLNDTNRFLRATFEEPVSQDLQPTDITIQDASSGENYGVYRVSVAPDGLSAQIELFEGQEDEPVLEENTEYEITVNNNGQILEGTFYDAEFTEGRIVDIDVEDDEFTIVDEDTGNSETITVPEDSDFEFNSALGENARVWFDEENDLVDYQIDSDASVTGAVEVSDSDEIEFVQSGEAYDISDETYDENSDENMFTLYINGEEVSDPEDTLANLEDEYFNFAKAGLDNSGDVEYLSLNSLNEFLVVESVQDDEIVGVDGEGTGGSFDAEDATIVKDGQAYTIDEVREGGVLEEGDILYFNPEADNEDGYAQVYENTVEGEIDTVYNDAIEVDGEVYDYEYANEAADFYDGETANTALYNNAVYVNDNGDTEYVDSDAAEELQAAGDVELHLDPAGNLVFADGETEGVAGDYSYVDLNELAFDENFGDPIAQLELVNEEGEENIYEVALDSLDSININGIEYDIENDDPDNDEYQVSVDGEAIVLSDSDGDEVERLEDNIASVIELGMDSDDNIDELGFFTTGSNEEEGAGQYDYEDENGAIEAGDDYVDGYQLENSTVVFDAEDGIGSDIDDVETTTWGDYSGSDITNAQYVYNEDGEVEALLINDTSAQDTEEVGAVVTDVRENTDDEIVQITAYVGDQEQTFDVDDVDEDVEDGEAVVLEFDENNEEFVEDIFTGSAADDYIETGLTVDSVDVGNDRVTFTNGETYTLVDDGAVIDATDTNDISDEPIGDLEDLEEVNNVSVVLDEDGSNFASNFVITDGDDAEDVAEPEVNLDDFEQVEEGQTEISLTGETSEIADGEELDLNLENSEGEEVASTTAEVTDDSFDTTLEVEDGIEAGEYEVTVSYDNEEIATSGVFTVEGDVEGVTLSEIGGVSDPLNTGYWTASVNINNLQEAFSDVNITEDSTVTLTTTNDEEIELETDLENNGFTANQLSSNEYTEEELENGTVTVEE